MKHSAALKVDTKELLVLNTNRDGIIYEVISVQFPNFIMQEKGTTCKPIAKDYSCCFRPTKAQLNAYKKRKEKYYASQTITGTGTSN